jgi:peptide-methionine (R)-S-oxide reductase
VCCGNELFSSKAKYDSGSGWPRFNQETRQGVIEKTEDLSIGTKRIELTFERVMPILGMYLKIALIQQYLDIILIQ